MSHPVQLYLIALPPPDPAVHFGEPPACAPFVPDANARAQERTRITRASLNRPKALGVQGALGRNYAASATAVGNRTPPETGPDHALWRPHSPSKRFGEPLLEPRFRPLYVRNHCRATMSAGRR